MGTMGGLLFFGSSFSFFFQMVISLLQAPYNWTASFSLLFIALPLILGLAVVRIVHSEDWESKLRSKIALIVIGIIAPFVWAGLYVGPFLVIMAGLIPMVR
jgi:hypothetical protein